MALQRGKHSPLKDCRKLQGGCLNNAPGTAGLGVTVAPIGGERSEKRWRERMEGALLACVFSSMAFHCRSSRFQGVP